MNGAQWVIRLLKENSVNVIFGYPGGAIMPIYDALFDSRIEHVLCRHEQGAAIAAIGYARATGKVGVCFATSGPGATNLITGLADAFLDSVPVIAITGQVGSNLIGTDAFQEVDVLGLSLSCTKHSFLVESLSVLPNIINKAFLIATKNRPGPVLIDIPKDIQLLSDSDVIFDASYIEEKIAVNTKVTSNLEIARLLIAESHRPVLYVGGGVGIAESVLKLREFIRLTGIPVVVTLKGLGSPDYNDSCYLGMLGMHGNQAANLVVQMCDLLIAVGARFDDRVTGLVTAFAPHAKVIHLDIDPSEFNKLRRADVTLLGDLNYFLSELTQSLSISDWRIEVESLKNKYCWLYNKNDLLDEKISAPELLKNINDSIENDVVITTDVGQHQMWVAQHMKFNDPKNFITSSGLGSMGFGIPAAVGAQIGRPDSTVICISGDGSFMMNVQELGTIKRRQLPVKIVLLDNQRLGMVRQWQELFFNCRYCETSLTDNPDFIMLAQSFSIDALSISYKNQIVDAIDQLFSNSGPFLLHVVIDEFENVWPLVPPGSSNDIMLDGATMI